MLEGMLTRAENFCSIGHTALNVVQTMSSKNTNNTFTKRNNYWIY